MLNMLLKIVNFLGLDNMLNLSAAEMREKLSMRKKRDPRQANMSLQQKYEIARNL